MHVYLRVLDEIGLKNIIKLQQDVHCINNLLGLHTIWKTVKRPVMFHASGKMIAHLLLLREYQAIIVFWHASHGYSGTLNDKTIFSLNL